MLEEETIQLDEGQLCVIPKGVMHKPESDEPSVVILFEPRKLKSRGD
jgi:mannose-6-phosphate isomerase-like protein (cupin superfamily)